MDLLWGCGRAVSRRFLDGYESVRVLTAEERSALPVLAVMLYPPNPHHYRWWRDQHGQDLVQQLRDDVWVMRTLQAEVERTFPALFEEAGDMR